MTDTDADDTYRPQRLSPAEMPSYEDLLGTECPVCGETIDFGSLRWVAGWQHKADSVHPQAGHHTFIRQVDDGGDE